MKDDPRDGIQSWSADGFWTSQGSPVLFVGATEAKFLQAEALFRDNKPDLAKEALKEAITSSMNKYQIDLTSDENIAYMDSVNTAIDGLTSDDFIKVLITEKYKHLFAHPEPYNDYRRTGYPELTPTQGNQIPRRYPYVSDEASYNAANVPKTNIYQRVWWDKE